MAKLSANTKQRLHIVNSVLILIAAIIVILLITGFIYNSVRSEKTEPLFKIGKSEKQEKKGNSNSTQEIRVYSGIGQLRILLSDSRTMILSIAFPYPASDTQFMEELASKRNDLRTITEDYFTSLPIEKLQNFNEDEAKREIMNKYNAVLRLGNISELYFSDLYIIN